MKTTTVLYSRKSNENSTTPGYPVAAWVGQVDLNETGVFCWSSDDDRRVVENVYSLKEVTLPDFLSVEEWVRDCITWKYVWGAGCDPSWPEAWQRGLLRMTNEQRVAACKLLKVKKFRSEFRRSLCEQVKTWLESEDRRYASPLSARQWDALIDRYTALDAERLSVNLYRSREYLGCIAA